MLLSTVGRSIPLANDAMWAMNSGPIKRESWLYGATVNYSAKGLNNTSHHNLGSTQKKKQL